MHASKKCLNLKIYYKIEETTKKCSTHRSIQEVEV